MGKVVVHRPGGGRGVKHCDQVGQMEWMGSLLAYLRQSQITYSSLMQSMMWPCVSRQFTKTFIVESSSPMVVLASLLEAVIYGKVEIVPAFLTDFFDKIKHLKTLVVERDRLKRIVICCKDMKTTNMVGLMVSELG